MMSVNPLLHASCLLQSPPQYQRTYTPPSPRGGQNKRQLATGPRVFWMCDELESLDLSRALLQAASSSLEVVVVVPVVVYFAVTTS